MGWWTGGGRRARIDKGTILSPLPPLPGTPFTYKSFAWASVSNNGIVPVNLFPAISLKI
jgi:hypothetical protein